MEPTIDLFLPELLTSPTETTPNICHDCFSDIMEHLSDTSSPTKRRSLAVTTSADVPTYSPMASPDSSPTIPSAPPVQHQESATPTSDPMTLQGLHVNCDICNKVFRSMAREYLADLEDMTVMLSHCSMLQ